MDNQQVKTYLDIGWLAGIIDGEGTITICLKKRSPKERGNRMDKLVPYISITNTNRLVIDNVIRIAKENGLPHYVQGNGTIYKGNHKPVYRIVAEGLGRCGQWLELITPFIVGKKEVAEYLYAFIQSRKKSIDLHPALKPYTSDEIELHRRISAFNFRGIKGRIPQRLHVED